MIFESIWHCWTSGIAALAVVCWGIASVIQMMAQRKALARMERRQDAIVDALSKLLVRTQHHNGEPRIGDVFNAVYQIREEMVEKLEEAEETNTSAAAIVARSIATAMPHLRRFSDWHAEWEARTKLAERKKMCARAAGYERRHEPPDPAQPPAPPSRKKTEPPG